MMTVTTKCKEPDKDSLLKRVEKRQGNLVMSPAIKTLGKPPYSVNGAINGNTGYVQTLVLVNI